MVKVFRLFFVASLASLSLACSSSTTTASDPPHPSQKEAGQDISTAICTAIMPCNADLKAKYNGNIQACESDIIAKSAPTDARDGCTQDQVDQCVKDTNALSCDAVNAILNGDKSKEPASCNGC